jgi:glycosyltransferase involved in cell wall biosynthesis
MRLKEHPLLREEFGRNGRDFVTKRYDRRKLAAELEGVLREVTGEVTSEKDRP